MPRLQSAYPQHHSTEMALLRVLSDIFYAADRQHITLLGLLDLSAAFDCIDHDILIHRLQRSFRFGGTVIAWIQSFLCSRSEDNFCLHGPILCCHTICLEQSTAISPKWWRQPWTIRSRSEDIFVCMGLFVRGTFENVYLNGLTYGLACSTAAYYGSWEV